MRAYAVLIVFSSVCLLASFFTVKDIMDDELKRNTNLLLKQVANEYDDAFKKPRILPQPARETTS